MTDIPLTETEIAAALKRRTDEARYYAERGIRKNDDGSFTAVISTPRTDGWFSHTADIRAQDDIVRRLEALEKRTQYIPPFGVMPPKHKR